MTTAWAYADAAVAVVSRDILVFRSYRMRFAAQVLRSCLAVTLFYYISRLVTVAPFHGPDAYFAFAVVGLVIVEVMFSTLSGIPGRVRHEIVAGTFERFVVSPFGPVAAVFSLSLFPLLLALVRGAVTLGFASAVFGMPVRWETLPLSLPVVFVGCLCFLSLGAIAAGAVILFKETQAGVGFLATGIAFVSGFVFPVALLPAWIEWASQVQPFTPILELLRNVIGGTPLEGSVAVAVAKIVVWSVVLLPPAAWLLGGAIRKSQERGTIIEY